MKKSSENKMEVVKSLLDEINPLRKKVKTNCLDYLNERLNNAKNKRIDLVDEDGDTSDCVCVTYDGGSHPEYDATPFSVVTSVFLGDDGKIYLETEDDDEYDIVNITWDELVDLCQHVYYCCE